MNYSERGVFKQIAPVITWNEAIIYQKTQINGFLLSHQWQPFLSSMDHHQPANSKSIMGTQHSPTPGQHLRPSGGHYQNFHETMAATNDPISHYYVMCHLCVSLNRGLSSIINPSNDAFFNKLKFKNMNVE